MVELKVTLPEGFLEEETRCDYTISKEMKECWAVQMDLLAELDRVCQAHGLRYFAYAGTLLGAVRHQGFIPWDDDIDVVMLREDYEKLQALPQSVYQEGYIMQSTYNDKVLRGHLQLRRDGTTMVTRGNYGARFHRGIFIDIFVLDTLPEDPKERARWKNKARLTLEAISFPIRRTLRSINGEPLPKRLLYLVIKAVLSTTMALGGGKVRCFRRFEALCQKYNGTDSPYVGNISFGCSRSLFCYKKEFYRDVVMLPFENIQIPCPIDYEGVLNTRFKNYKKFKKGTSLHGGLYDNSHTSYEEYDALTKKEFDALCP